MKSKRPRRISAADREKRINGLLFGLIAGFWLGVGIWGMDAFLLASAHGDLPWLKFVLGTPCLIIIGGLAGWLTAIFDRAAIGAGLWLLASIGVVWIASHMPFEGLSWAIGLLDRNFAGLEIYPFVESARIRMSLLYVVVGAITALGGAFEIFFVEAATGADSHFTQFLKLASCVIIFIPIGLTVDNLINGSLRNPIQGVNDLIQLGLEAKTREIPIEEQRQMGLRKLTPFRSFISEPYTIILGPYDPETLDESSVYTDFSGEWGMCSVIGVQPMVCRISSDRYLNKLACLIKTGDVQSCHFKLAEKAAPPPKEVFSELDQGELKFGIIGQRGTAVIVVAEDSQGDQVKCLLREAGDVYLEACTPEERQAFDPMPLPPTPTRAPKLTPTAPDQKQSLTQMGSAEINPKAALLDPSLLELPVLDGAPVYRISLSLDEDLRSFQGGAEVEITNRVGEPLNELYFHLLPNGDGSYGNGGLDVIQTRINGKPIETELSLEDTALKIPLPDALEPTEKIRVDFQFEGEVPKDFGGGETPAGYGIFNFSDGVLALSGWYPILAVYDDQGWNLDRPSDLGDSVYSETGFYQVNLDIPAGLLAAATGVEVDRAERDDREQILYESGPVRDFFLVISGNLKSISQKIDGVQVNSYYFPGRDQAGEQALGIAVESLKIFNQKFGEYPYRELDVAAAPMQNASGVEFPGIVLIGASLYDAPEKSEFSVTIAHEVAHQWWYGVVGNDVFDEPWLDEATTTYSSSLYFEYGLGLDYARGLQQYWQDGYDRFLSEGSDDSITASLDHFESLKRPAVYGAVVYTKGALFFQALREEIGDEAFFKGLQDYYDKEFFGIARSDDLLAEFERAAGRSLADFYQQWLNLEP